MIFTRRKLADAEGVNAETIRFYARAELLTQSHKPIEGFRQYSSETLLRLSEAGYPSIAKKGKSNEQHYFKV
ncbi:MerR family transcriptional regulator [Vibrio profundum]|uniref:MerR family transcriptional regulator n=1 Tax=Vibrio profundum TaxID=2910247 RepID=UPI003D09CDD4